MITALFYFSLQALSLFIRFCIAVYIFYVLIFRKLPVLLIKRKLGDEYMLISAIKSRTEIEPGGYKYKFGATSQYIQVIYKIKYGDINLKENDREARVFYYMFVPYGVGIYVY